MTRAKKTALLMAAAALICAAAVFALTRPGNGRATPFGRDYNVESVVYEAGVFSFSYTPETAPRYRLTDGGELTVLERGGTEAPPATGTFEETALTAEEFDSCFLHGEIWHGGASAAALRRGGLPYPPAPNPHSIICSCRKTGTYISSAAAACPPGPAAI